jgi:PAS domain S-box-containing protein
MLKISLNSKLLIVMGLIFAFSGGSLIYIDYNNTRDEIFQSMYQESRSIKELLMSIRSVYSHQFVQSGVKLTDKTVGFLPAHAMGKISKNFSSKVTWGVSFNNVSDRARNPDQQADKHEMEAINFFINDRDAKERMVIQTNKNGEDYYHYTSPLWIKQMCLKCHGKREDAPAAVRNNYDKAYNYKVGDIRGIISIKLSASILENALNKHIFTSTAAMFLGFLLTYIAVFYIFKSNVLSRITLLSDATKRVFSGDYSREIPESGRDQISRVIEAFNYMTTAVRNREDKLKDSYERTRAIIDGSAEGIIMSDQHGKIIDINKSACELFSFNMKEILGSNIDIMVPPEYIKQHHQGFDRVANYDTKPMKMPGRIEVTAMRQDGTTFPIELNIRRSLYEGETVFIAIMHDVTKRKKAEEEVEKTKQKYFHQEKIAAIGQMASGILHEIGNPIAAMTGSTQHLQDINNNSDLTIDSLKKENLLYLDIINKQSERLSGLTKEIANFISPQVSEAEIFDLNTLIKQNKALLRYDHRLKYIHTVYNFAENIPAICAIQDHIVQIFLNLLVNAGHAFLSVEDKDKPPRIIVSTSQNNDYVVLAIADNGCGMSDETQKSAFDAFFTTKETGVGTGLGLSLCLSLAQEQGGKIEIISQQGIGTEVSVFLPAIKEEKES